MRWIPNALTLGNAMMGCLAISLLADMHLEAITACMIAALIMDVFDGFTARKLGIDGPLGIQLDSLADAITFGALPALLWMQVGLTFFPFWFAALGLAPALASVYRLARFNLGLAGAKGFVGLPTPANALFLLGVVWFTMNVQASEQPYAQFADGPWAYVCFAAITLFSAYSLNSHWHVMSVKDMPKGGPALWFRLLFIALSVLLFIIFRFEALAFIIPLLLIFSALEKRLFKITAS
ncbi:MAG: hypothetical protein ABR98_07935 [Cryomorphaceae bacterium BACL7 MAG-120910-bin2]|jgi:CDP-diacylglycerol---serine O-phosphatidyltransferase|nr:MAG: hypothetical protein ABR98_07935 [Cryomorphaceae bacterium BACL7 MAG-120910-bin2]KRO68721.1 MAG: hypothetical protein ABR88_07150 [Cryomorphaceae bacterium BACL7 MAG-120322-bin74]KRO84079.1 MAG: hypothetical protein ABR87_05945 [Cryomorphaceae bacterium BACL7 MAG-121220-bin83]